MKGEEGKDCEKGGGGGRCRNVILQLVKYDTSYYFQISTFYTLI